MPTIHVTGNGLDFELTSPTVAPVAAATITLTHIVGSLFHESGEKMTTGALVITPTVCFGVGGDLIGATPTVVLAPVSGDFNFYLAPNPPAAPYRVEYDPDPASSLPLQTRPGYFKLTPWVVPAVTSVDIGTL